MWVMCFLILYMLKTDTNRNLYFKILRTEIGTRTDFFKRCEPDPMVSFKTLTSPICRSTTILDFT